MNLDSLSFALSQISYLVANLTKKNSKLSVQELDNLISNLGNEAEQHLFTCLFSQVDFSGDSKVSGKDYHQTQYLIHKYVELIKKPHFISTLCYALTNPSKNQKSLKPTPQLLTQLGAVLKLNPIQETALGIALLHSPELQECASQFLSQKIPDIVLLGTGIDSTSTEIKGLFAEIPIEVCQLIIQHIIDNQEKYDISPEKLSEFVARTDTEISLNELSGFRVLLQSDDCDTLIDEISVEPLEMAKTVVNSLHEVMCDLGYGCCVSVECCRNHLLNHGSNDITPLVVAQILGMMVRTHTGLTSIANSQCGSLWNDAKDPGSQLTTWNVGVFVQTLEEVVPSLSWKDVVMELDHPGFVIKDRQGLKLLAHALNVGLKNEEFPIKFYYKQWRNFDGQLSLYQFSLKNSDVFCFADHPCHTVALEMLKAPPDDDNREIATWKSKDLVETLLYLSDAGQYVTVRDLFTYPLQHCPDVLVLNLLQLNSQMNRLRQELLTSLIPMFLVNHPNSAIILQFAWNTQSNSAAIKSIVMRALPEWYMRAENDQTRLSRILDVAQDLKALSLLLNGSPLPFVIDLACLASRREYLKLDKWLTDKLREHGEQFIQASVSFLKRRCPQLVGCSSKEENMPKSQQLPPETISTILGCLQAYSGGINQELSEIIVSMANNCNVLINKARQAAAAAAAAPGVGKSRGLDSVFSSTSLNSAAASGSPTLDPLVSGIGSGMSGLSIGSSSASRISSVSSATTTASTATVGGVFPLTGALNAFANTPSSPAKMMFAGLNSSNSNSSAQSAFSSLLPSVGPLSASQLQTLSASASHSDLVQLFPVSPNLAKEVEEEANRYFACLYNIPQPTMTVEGLIEVCKRLKDSSSQIEREIFNCMMRYLFDEYKFFPKYPDKDLQINAQLFGLIIEYNLVTYLALGIALRYLLDAARKPPGTNMYMYAVTALDRCRNRLKEYPQYCQHLASIPHFNEFPAQVKESVEIGMKASDPIARPQAIPVTSTASMVVTTSAVTAIKQASVSSVPTAKTITVTTSSSGGSKSTAAIAAKPSIANATNIDTLLVATENDDKIEVPPENVQDKIGFIVNNLSLANLTQKCEEIRDVLSENYWLWFAQYIVMKRASIEPNFHNLYSNFLDTLKLSRLVDLVIKETYRNIRVLLRSDKGIANFSDRSLLKNLGHWLGIVTLTKNKPILQLDLDIKSLLIEAYHNGQQELLYVVPFIAKVLDSCAKSRVFKSPNPWTIGIMNVLAELHSEPDLKLNLKFEVEVLCKALAIDLTDLNPGNILKDREKLGQIEPQLSQKHKEISMVQDISASIQNVTSVEEQQQQQLQQQHHHIVSSFAPSSISAGPTGFGTPTSMFLSSNTQIASVAPPVVDNESITPTVTPQPQFNYNDLNISSLSGLSNHIQINSQIAFLQQHPHLKQFVCPAIERAVQDWIVQVVERSIKIALTTCEQIIKKDFALDPEEPRMRAAAHHMVCSLTAGMAMITCKDHLSLGISTNLKNTFTNALKGAALQSKEIMDQAVSIVTQENIELACCFIQKTAVEKAIPEIDKRLATEFELRKHARNEGRRYCDPSVLTYQAERMPEQIRLKVGGVTAHQMAVYEGLARNIPGFLPTSEPMPLTPLAALNAVSSVSAVATSAANAAFLAKPIPVMPAAPAHIATSIDDISQIFDKVAVELENYLRGLVSSTNSLQVSLLHTLLDTLLVARSSRDVVSAIMLLQKAVEGLLEGITPQLANEPDVALRFRDGHLLVLKAMQDPRAYGPQWTNKHVTRFVVDCRDDLHYNLDAIDILIRNHLINMQQYDVHLAQSMEGGMNYVSINFCVQFCRLYLINDRQSSSISESDLYNTLETLFKIASHSRQVPEGLTQLIDLIRTNTEPGFLDRGPTSLMHSGISQAREFDDPPGLHEKTEFLLRDWVSMYHSASSGRDFAKVFSMFVNQMNIQGILKTDDLISRFFRLSTEMCVDLCHRALSDPTVNPSVVRVKCFHTLDAFVRLIALLVQQSGDSNNTSTKINLLNKVLGIITGVLLQDHEVHNTEFQQLPYHRIFIILFLELNAPEPILEAINFQVLTAFCNSFHVLRPTRAPGFAYAWLELVSHRVLIGRMLQHTPHQKAWGMYAQLMMDLFKFLAPFLRNAELPKCVALLYKGTLRVLLVLLHDFPEFLCDYHYGFCDVIPPNCIQMRNLILSAFPRNMRLPDPFTPNLKVDMLPEIAHAPRVLTNFASIIQPLTFKKDLDSYIKTRAPVTFLSELRSNLQVSNEAGQRYNIPLINALVLYVGSQAIGYIHSKGLTPSMSTITHSSHMDIFQNLAVDLDTEGRYLFLNAIANQLRYPNSHTHYFSCTLLYLFAEANTEAIQEQITRVLLERLIVNRPHPWGLLITFIELIKNPNFHFWNHEFVHCAPEIEKLFESVARSCMPQKQAQVTREPEPYNFPRSV